MKLDYLKDDLSDIEDALDEGAIENEGQRQIRLQRQLRSDKAKSKERQMDSKAGQKPKVVEPVQNTLRKTLTAVEEEVIKEQMVKAIEPIIKAKIYFMNVLRRQEWELQEERRLLAKFHVEKLKGSEHKENAQKELDEIRKKIGMHVHQRVACGNTITRLKQAFGGAIIS